MRCNYFGEEVAFQFVGTFPIAETSATATNLGVSLETRPTYAAELAPADPKITRKPLIKDVKAKTTMGDEAREERNQLARQDASVSTFNRRSPLGRSVHKCFRVSRRLG
ncbi:hypothetical protein ANCDUO_02100 [Ancylostoma duodenale]|uniref:Uncharacterized protein n=1 Tax=Ancylostoma duodenale TaxID=51022 RepID=A0A0C2H7M1_9BILA|nr:hypothetical protein ANCDUO_02100 [Ancylostoma duodenale]